MKKYNKPSLNVRKIELETIIASSGNMVSIANPNSGAHAVTGTAVETKARGVNIDANIDF